MDVRTRHRVRMSPRIVTFKSFDRTERSRIVQRHPASREGCSCVPFASVHHRNAQCRAKYRRTEVRAASPGNRIHRIKIENCASSVHPFSGWRPSTLQIHLVLSPAAKPRSAKLLRRARGKSRRTPAPRFFRAKVANFFSVCFLNSWKGLLLMSKKLNSAAESGSEGQQANRSSPPPNPPHHVLSMWNHAITENF